jgi:hypothetical protein
VPKVSETVDVLRQGWMDAATAFAPDVESVRQTLEKGLRSAERHDSLNEQTLLTAIDEAMLKGGDEIPQDVGQALVRRLQRSVYEYLLSLDATKPEEAVPWPGDEALRGEGAVLIGVEEVAALRADQPPPAATPVPAPAAPEPAPAEAAQPTAPEPAPVEAAQPAAPEPAPSMPEAVAPAVEAAAHDPAAAEAGSDAPQAPPEKAGRRFAIFGRSSAPRAAERPPHVEPGAEQPIAATPEAAAPASERAAAEPTPAPSQSPAPAPIPPRADERFTPLPRHHGQDGEPYMAPREGFHIHEETPPLVISTPSNLGGGFDAPRPLQRPSPDLSVPVPAAELPRDKGWSVREDAAGPGRLSRPPGEGKFLRASDPADDDQFASSAVVEARKTIEDRLGRRRCDDAAALIQKLAQEPGGRAVAELGLNAGDRCRALGKHNAALSCYLAATRADPVFNEPLLRLADICIDDHDIDLAVAYLERVARFYKLSGNHQEAIRVFRKIATIAPYRDDILSMLVRIQATGRFDD